MKHIKKFLLDTFFEYQSSTTRHDFKKWINKLICGTIDTKRLAYCIAIDVKFNLAAKEKYIKVFENLDYSSSISPNLVFENAILKNEKLHFFSNNKASPNKRYTRVLTLEDLIKFFLIPAQIAVTVNDKHEVSQRIKNNEFNKIIFPINSGPAPRHIGWILPLEELQNCVSRAEKANLNPANQVIDRLGLDREFIGTDRDEFPEYVYIIYPEKFNESAWQPIAINSKWASPEGLYLSYKDKDNHGRTRPLRGDRIVRRHQELIHNGLINKKHVYSIKYLGKVTLTSKSIKSIIRNAEKRFHGS